MARALRAFPQQRTLLVWEEGVPPAQGIVWKALTAAADTRDGFAPLTEVQARSWITERLKGTGRTIAPEAAARLLAREGTNLWSLASELEKLVLLKASGPITPEDVDDLAPARPVAEIFATVQAIARGDRRTAFARLVAARAAGEEPRRLFFLLVRELRNLLHVRDRLDRGERLTAWSIAGDLRLPRAAAEALLDAARRTTLRGARDLFDRSLVAYYHLNLGRAEPEEVLETLALMRPAEREGSATASSLPRRASPPRAS